MNAGRPSDEEKELTPPFRLIPGHISHETISALEQLLSQARRGELLGIAFCAMYRGRRYIVDTTGEAERNPTFTLGMLRALDFKLCSKLLKR